MDEVDVSQIEYLQVNVEGLKVFRSRNQTAVMYAVYPRNKLVRLTDHALKRRLADGWVSIKTKEDYEAYLANQYVPSADQPWKPDDEEFFAKRRTKKKEKVTPQDTVIMEDVEEAVEPEYDDDGNPLRDGMDVEEFWETHRQGPPEGKKGAGKGVCPDCGKKWTGKAKLFKCCFKVPAKPTA
jgi:hypothetical protein